MIQLACKGQHYGKGDSYILHLHDYESEEVTNYINLSTMKGIGWGVTQVRKT
jgi:hypothetical protein